ncbi:hypothetical protein [Haloarcula laminariae]|uniref:hypothetical protein n=1 Tax=Haloarcula laminariae TaxID=2961577 RepID=UPI00240775FA|nr:hypothetical protein [Halomicroarcula sp. FL173]
MTAVEAGEVVTLTELDSEPPLLVLAVDEDLTGTLLADLAYETTSGLRILSVTVRDGRRSRRPSRTPRVSCPSRCRPPRSPIETSSIRAVRRTRG